MTPTSVRSCLWIALFWIAVTAAEPLCSKADEPRSIRRFKIHVEDSSLKDLGRLSFQPPVCKAGDYVLLRAEMDCVVAFSACPQDIVPINGRSCTPTEAHFQILEVS